MCFNCNGFWITVRSEYGTLNNTITHEMEVIMNAYFLTYRQHAYQLVYIAIKYPIDIPHHVWSPRINFNGLERSDTPKDSTVGDNRRPLFAIFLAHATLWNNHTTTKYLPINLQPNSMKSEKVFWRTYGLREFHWRNAFVTLIFTCKYISSVDHYLACEKCALCRL